MAKSPLTVLVKGPFNPFSGYGGDVICLTQSLIKAGVNVLIDPMNMSPPLPPEVAALLVKPLEPPFDLIIQHTDPGQMELSNGARRAADVTVGWTMWESLGLQNLNSRRTLRKRLRNFDILAGYDHVTRESFAPYCKPWGQYPKIEQITIQGGFDASYWKPVQRDWNSERFGFCMVGQLHDRKDPFLAIQAFQELKEEHPVEFEPAELHLKNQLRNLHPAMEQWIPKLRVHYANWPKDVLYDFYAAQHVLLAPSRGEGKNLPCLEFMSTGGTAIATNWGGHQMWMSKEYAYPLDYSLKPFSGEDRHKECLQARASKDHLKELMLHVFRNRSEVRTKGQNASVIIPQMCSWDVVVENLFRQIGDHLPGKGERVRDLFNSCEPRK